MAKYKWFELSTIKGHRGGVEDCLVERNKLRPSTDKNESAAPFWARVEQAGLLVEALDLYDEFAEQDADWVHSPRETKKKFAERIEREGRQTEVEPPDSSITRHGGLLRSTRVGDSKHAPKDVHIGWEAVEFPRSVGAQSAPAHGGEFFPLPRIN